VKESIYNPDQYPWDHVDNIDAALFTGDHFYDMEELIVLQYMLARWSSKVAEIMDTLNEVNNNPESEDEEPDCQICNNIDWKGVDIHDWPFNHD